MEGIQCSDCTRRFGSDDALAAHRDATHQNPDWVRTKGGRAVGPQCPKCGEIAKLSAGKFGTKAECCGLWSWNLKPLVGRETHAARIQAHDAFDRLWKRGEFSRGEGYRRLQIAMGMTTNECHIAQMTEAQALRVVLLVRSGALTEKAPPCP